MHTKYNEDHGITPASIRKDVISLLPEELMADAGSGYLRKKEKDTLEGFSPAELEKMMWQAVERLDFEKAARLRDTLASLEGKELNRVAMDSNQRSKRTQSKKHRR